MVSYQPGRASHPQTHPWVRDLEAKVIRGHVAMKAALKMRDEYGFNPDLIFAHHGWGESLFLKEIWPRARMLLYSEWYYPLDGADMGFDPSSSKDDCRRIGRLRSRMPHNLLAMEVADAGDVTHPFGNAIRTRRGFVSASRLSMTASIRGVARHPACLPPLRLPIPADPACGIVRAKSRVAPGRRDRHVRQSQPRTVPRLPYFHARVPRVVAASPAGAGGDHRRQRGRAMAARRRGARGSSASWMRYGP